MLRAEARNSVIAERPAVVINNGWRPGPGAVSVILFPPGESILEDGDAGIPGVSVGRPRDADPGCPGAADPPGVAFLVNARIVGVQVSAQGPDGTARRISDEHHDCGQADYRQTRFEECS